MGICVTINAWAYMLPMGLSAAMNTSVSNALGAGNAAGAAGVFKTGLALAVLLQAGITGLLVMGGGHLVGYLCQEEAVRALTCQTLPILSLVIILDGLNSVMSGVLRGAGRQKLGATVNAMCCCLALPAAWALAFKANLGVHGFWVGVAMGAGLQLAIVLGILMPASLKFWAAGPASGSGGGAASNGKGAQQPAGKHWGWDWEQEALRMRSAALAPAT